jgi:23S rRNA (adenine2503-C2)-methyltransferase
VTEPRLAFDLSLEDLTAEVLTWGEPAFRARQIWHALYRRFASSAEPLTELPPRARLLAAERLIFTSGEPAAVSTSPDGDTVKILHSLRDGSAVESVDMRHPQGHTLCISTQAGCGMGCAFCATGHMGLVRNLSAGEIVEQVIFHARRLRERSERLANIVVMGMGEPLHNYDATMAAVDRLNDPQGFRFGARRITISTVGLVPGIDRFSEERRQVNLAVSLHAATNALRDQLVPINQRYPLEVLLPACRRYVEKTGRRISFEWVMIKGLNDSLEQARALSEWARGLTCHVNLIPLNPTAAFTGEASTPQALNEFSEFLRKNHIACTVRARRGIEIRAGCGQLATRARKDAHAPAGDG